MSHHRIASNLLALYVVQGMQYLFPILILPVITRAIGPERYGTLSFWQSLAAGLILIIEYGFNYSAIRAINQTSSRPAQHEIFWSTTWAKMLLLLPATAILIGTAMAVARHGDGLLIAAAWLSLLGAAASPAWYFIAMRRNVPVAVLGATTSFLAVIAVLRTVHDAGDFHTAAFIQLGMPVVSAVLMLVYLGIRFPPGRPRLCTAAVASRIKEGTPLFLMTIGAGAYSSFNPFLLGLVAPSAQVADYALAERLARAAKNGVGPILTAMYPYAAEGKSGAQSTRLRLFRAALATLALSALIAVLLILLAPLAVLLIAGPAFLSAVSVTRILAINIAVVTAGHLVGVQYLVARGKEKFVTIITVVSAPVHIITILLAGQRFGAIGGALAYVGTEILVTLAFGTIALRLGKES